MITKQISKSVALVLATMMWPGVVHAEAIYLVESLSARIVRMNLDGSNWQDVITNIAPSSLVLDTDNELLYFFDTLGLRRANMGGSDVQLLIDMADEDHALNCFTNQDTMGNPGAYPCELHPDYPPTAFNVDAGGQFGECSPDGVCDGNDAFHGSVRNPPREPHS